MLCLIFLISTAQLQTAAGALQYWWPLDRVDSTGHVRGFMINSTGSFEITATTKDISTVQGPGKRSAIYIGSDGWIDLGSYRGSCITRPHLCQDGVTFSFWLKHDVKRMRSSFVHTGNASIYDKSGFNFQVGWRGSSTLYQFVAKEELTVQYVNVDVRDSFIGVWNQFIVVYSTSHMDVYINGTKTGQYFSRNFVGLTIYSDFRIGNRLHSYTRGDFHVSDLNIVLKNLSAGEAKLHFYQSNGDVRQCFPLVAPRGGSMNCSSNNSVGSICHYKCRSGYHVMGSKQQRCLWTGFWTGQQPSECARPCRILDISSNVMAHCSDSNLPGSTCTFSCPSSFARDGLPEIYCHGNSVWSGVPPNCSYCPGNCSCLYPDIYGKLLTVSCVNTNYVRVPNNLPEYTRKLILDSSELSELSNGDFDNLDILEEIQAESCKVSKIEDGTFRKCSRLKKLTLTGNRISQLANGTFHGLENLRELYLTSNRISVLEDGTFTHVPHLLRLFLDDNRLTNISAEIFRPLKNLEFLILKGNQISSLHYSALEDLHMLRVFDFAENKMEKLPSSLLRLKQFLQHLDCSNNKLTIIQKTVVENLGYLALFSISQNRLTQLPQPEIRDRLQYLYADDNLIRVVNKQTFAGAFNLRDVRLINNPVETIEEGTFDDSPSLKTLNLINTKISIISTTSLPRSSQLEITFAPMDKAQRLTVFAETGDVLSYEGYSCFVSSWNVDDDGKRHRSSQTCTACLRGQYMAGGQCYDCPAGGFFQDVFAFKSHSDDAIGCKSCPNGKYVSPKMSPGKNEHDCIACPTGTQLEQWAGFRGCLCLTDHYRLDRFGVCMECTKEFVCMNESVTLRPGYYWKWKSDFDKEAYVMFSKQLLIFNDSHDMNTSRYNYSLPRAYPCPVPDSCLGGQDAMCARGYTGPLCAVCDKGFYKLVSSCHECPSVTWLIVRVVGLVIVIVVLTLFWMKTIRGYKDSNERSSTDSLLARIKITISFYQVTSGTLMAFSYISWPTALIKLLSYADIFQFNVLQFLPVECFNNSLQFDPFAGFLLYISLNAGIIIGCIGYFQARKLINNNMTSIEGKSEIRELKVKLYRVVFLVLFVSYPATCTRIFQILPSSCHELCRSDQQGCSWFLYSDYRVQCYTKKYNMFLYASYAAIAFPVLFPMVTLFLLWKFTYKLQSLKNISDKEHINAISDGMRFLYENYKPQYWFWEVIELVRKIVLTSVLVYFGAVGRIYLGTAAILSGIYAVLHAYFQPMKSTFEHWLQLIALLATCVNYNTGLLLRIPDADDLLVGSEADNIGVSVLLVSANVIVVSVMAVRYTVIAWKVLCHSDARNTLHPQRKKISMVHGSLRPMKNKYSDGGYYTPNLQNTAANKVSTESAVSSEEGKEEDDAVNLN